jgi:3-oxoadipate enol-lactonase
MDLEPGLQRIGAATVVIVGTLDPSTPPRYGETIAAGIAGSRLHPVETAHLANWERPDVVNGILATHLDRSN